MNNGRIALVIAACLLATSGLCQQPVTEVYTRPPRELHQIDYPNEPHHTAYTPPKPEEIAPGTLVHVIEKGDTLWDLATTYLQDPYYWPQIWEATRYISEPRWIYPGDPLVIPRPLVIAEIPPPPPPEDDFLIDISKLPSPEPAAKHSDVYCANLLLTDRETLARVKGGRPLSPTVEDVTMAADGDFISGTGAAWEEWSGGPTMPIKTGIGNQAPDVLDEPKTFVAGPPRLVGSEYGTDRVSLATGDVVYLNRGEADGVRAGDEFFVIRRGRVVHRPWTTEVVGVAMQNLGRIKVLCTQSETATATVEECCAPMMAGDLLKSYEPIPIPLVSEFHPTPAHCELTSAKVKGMIVYAKDDRVTHGEADIVNIDIGSDAGLAPGDFLVVYRANSAGDYLPDKILGDAVVLLVDSGSATTKIVSSHEAIHRGDLVALR